MAADDITAPLGLDKGRKGRRLRIPFGLIATGLVSIFALFVIVWVTVVDDPLGGQPTAQVPLIKSRDGITARDIEVVSVKPSDRSGAPSPATTKTTRDSNSNGGTDHAKTNNSNESSRSNDSRSTALTTSPVAKVTEAGRHGPLPIIAKDGSRPLDVYAAPPRFQVAGVPRIVIIVGGLGLSQTGSQSAIEKLPNGITFAFAPYGSSLDRWMKKARRKGHEILLQIPLEPFDFPDNDPGPHTLLTSLAPAANIDRMTWLMARVTNYAGVINHMGARFSSSSEALGPMIEEINKRGLMLIDDGSSSRSVMATAASAAKAPFARADLVIDSIPSPEEIDGRLLQLEAIARSKGLAIGVASALPVSVKEIAEWANTAEARGVYLVPASAAVRVPGNGG